MATDWGFDFRSTTAYVTDPSNCSAVTYEGSGATNATYPHLYGNGATGGFGNPFGMGGRDRNSGIDARLAGNMGTDGSTVFDFRVDLDATGDWDIRYALGDATYAQAGPINVKLYDNTTVLDTLASGSTSAGQHYIDASHVERTSASDWVTNNVSIRKTFATTTFFLKIGDPSGTFQPLSHLRLTSAALNDSGAGFLSRFAWAPNRNPFKRRGLRASPQITGPNDTNDVSIPDSFEGANLARFGWSPSNRPMVRRHLRASAPSPDVTAAAPSTIVFRKTLSSIGTKTGSHQTQNS